MARRSIRRALAATGAALLLASGLALGLNSERVPDADAAYAAYQKGNRATALRLSQPLAEQGDARAQSLLGLIHYNDRGVLRDDAETVKWLVSLRAGGCRCSVPPRADVLRRSWRAAQRRDA